MEKRYQKRELDVIVNDEARGIVWEGVAEAVSSTNSQGPFDILPQHANFITLIKGTPIRVRLGSNDQEFTFATAVLSVQDNRVRIYAISDRII